MVLLFSIGLGLLMDEAWAWLGALSGSGAAIALAGVGMYPMNKLTPHTRAATAFFRLGMVMILFFTVAIALQPGDGLTVARPSAVAGLPAVLANAYFLIYATLVFRSSTKALGTQIEHRPRIWPLAIAEWAIFLTTVPWFFAITLGL